MNVLVDVHTHTIASGHAVSTLQEMVSEASRKGLRILGITEHGPAQPDAVHPRYFHSYPVVPRDFGGVKLLLGCEVNILDKDGTLDLEEDFFRYMDFCSAGIHTNCWTPGTKAQNTEGALKVLANPHIKIMVHPGDGSAELDFEALVKQAKKERKLLEINNHTFRPWRHKDSAKANNTEILRLCRRYDLPVIIGSDAHISCDIGRFDYALALMEEVGFPMELVLNDKPREFLDYLSIPDNYGEMI